jgi:hypothetical protein
VSCLLQVLTCPLGGLQAFAGLEGQTCILEDTPIVLPTARGAANVCLLHHIPNLQVEMKW